MNKAKTVINYFLKFSFIVVGGYLLFLVYALWDFSSKEVEVPFERERTLDDAAAIWVSKVALVKVLNIDPTQIRPALFDRNSTKYFARNLTDKDSGYVLWKVYPGEHLFDYSVSLKRNENFVYAEVGKTK